MVNFVIEYKLLIYYIKGMQLYYEGVFIVCMYMVLGFILFFLQGFFLFFFYGIGLLLVSQEYLVLEDGFFIFRQDIMCFVLFDFMFDEVLVMGLLFCIVKFFSLFIYFIECLRVNLGLFVVIIGILVDFFFLGYLDVLVFLVCFVNLCIQLIVIVYVVGFFYLEIVDLNGFYCFICVYCKLVCFLLFLIVQVFIVYVQLFNYII